MNNGGAIIHRHGCIIDTRNCDLDIGLMGVALLVGYGVAEVDIFRGALSKIIKLASRVVNNTAGAGGKG